MTIPEAFFSVLFLAVASAGFSLFLAFCFAEGGIFYRYFRWLEHTYQKSINYSPEGRARPHPLAALLKPMGLCIYCSNFWVCFAAYGLAAFAGALPEPEGWAAFALHPLLFVGVFSVSHTVLRVVLKYVDD